MVAQIFMSDLAGENGADGNSKLLIYMKTNVRRNRSPPGALAGRDSGGDTVKPCPAHHIVVELVITSEQGHQNADDTDGTDSRGSIKSPHFRSAEIRRIRVIRVQLLLVRISSSA
jgi:hypothetical protein